ncbi:MAG: 4Fe-4S dicluster domain-containing protein [archaeon]|nr:4Fe-4S dicluster domain-containing protein [archaeon]MCR4323625.1 4Fe-4S dicluster domain-containing protein [Nanoarchaeota archaeon]
MKHKISEQDKIEANNLIEKASEIMAPCISCGICRADCATFNVTKEESLTPRGYAALLKAKVLDEAFFKSTMDGSCKNICPLNLNVDEAILAVREAMVLKGKGLKSNEERFGQKKQKKED